MAQVLYADGRVETMKPAKGRKFSLEEMQKVVNGYIEITHTIDGRLMVVNEEGKLNGLPYNPRATSIHRYHDMIVGDVLVCSDKEID